MSMELTKTLWPLATPSIARRLLLALLAATGLLCAVVYGAVQYRLQYPESGCFDRELHALTSAVLRVVEASPDPRAVESLAMGMDSLLVELDDYRSFKVTRRDGHVLVSSRKAPQATLGGPGQAGYYDAQARGEHYRVHAAWSRDGQYRVEVAQSLTRRQAAFTDSLNFQASTLGPALLLGLPLYLALSWLAVRAGLRPLLKLSDDLQARRPDDLQPITLRHVYAELAPVIHGLNTMLARLRLLLQRERDFLADAAHELRTPVAVLTAQVDTLLQASNPAERAEVGQRLRSGAARMTRLINQLLALARLEAAVDNSPVPTDLADVARECLAGFETEARARRIDLAYVGPDTLPSLCPGNALQSVLTNLVGNAVRYADPGCTVEVDLRADPAQGVRLLVRDNGPGIALADRKRVFERFQRGNGVSAPGSGLGLSVVAAAAQQLGARIDLTDGLHGRGLGVRLQWRPVP
jgi:signal transduction histidine kinase